MIQKRYEGFLNTPSLWPGNSVFNLKQFEKQSKPHRFNVSIDDNLRLGKYVERFVSFELNQDDTISIIEENIQIQHNKTTLGEIDCLLLKDDKPVHLEVIYKFYVFDDSVGTTEINHFIGPNRKDSLKEKLSKLKEKQLPLLFSKACEPYLKKHHLNTRDIEQQVYFKAQLFLPFIKQDITLTILNNACVAGFYINQNELKQFSNCKYFIPNKKDWLIEPHPYIDWLNFNDFCDEASVFLGRKFSPMCWIKFSNGELKKMFLVWW